MRVSLAALMMWAGAVFAQEGGELSQESLDSWLLDYRNRAVESGIAETTLDAVLPDINYLPIVVERDRNQNEFSKTIWDYLDTAVSQARVANGERAMDRAAQTLAAVEAEFGVDRHIVAAIWGLESAYGAFRGDTPTLSALASLALEGRRGAFFEAQLTAALQILAAGDTTPVNMKGSWAGAMGHTQFMPTNYLTLAVDFDGDGRRDIWGDDPADALASTAAFLRDAGWTTGQRWGVEVRLPEGFDHTQARREGTRYPSAWAAIGVVAADGSAISDENGGGSILLPAGHEGPAFMVFGNFAVLERYNKADAYVIAVGHLADRLRGLGPVQASWPRGDRALTFEERRELQQLLTDAGYSSLGVDGIIGPNTINAVRRYQQSVGLVADGYPSVRLLEALRSQ